MSNQKRRKRERRMSAPSVAAETVREWLEQAEALRKASRWQEAERAYRRILDAAPECGRAWCGLGEMALQGGQPQQALICHEKAAACGVSDDLMHANALRRLGRVAEAVAVARQGLTREQDSAPLWNEFAADLYLCRDHDEAFRAISQALALAPDDALALNNLGMIEAARYHTTEAIAAFLRSLALRPGDAYTMRNCGLMLMRLGRMEQALVYLRQALARLPESALIHNDIASALIESGEFDAAIPHVQTALRIKPGYADALQNLLYTGKLQVAEDVFNGLQPSALRLSMLAALYAMHGRLEQAADIYRQLVKDPQFTIEKHSAYLLHLHYLPDYTPESAAQEHRQWARRHLPARSAECPFNRTMHEQRRLRIGYVSPDFRRHSVASFIAPILQAHDRASVEVFCYFDYRAPDPVTLQLRAFADVWRDIATLNDEEAATQIRADDIDILVDLAGHTGKRLPLFARRAAPVQATYLGYPDTTGVPAMDYRFSDAIADPPGGGEEWYSEELVRLPVPFLCFQPPVSAPAVEPLACAAGKPLTFGSLNNLPKVSAASVRLWAAVLRALPESRLLLKNRAFSDPSTCRFCEGLFAAEGIAPERLCLYAFRAEVKSHLATYHEIDIALDTVPYNGTTTTCEALWMGVPVITLAGESHCARVGASLLQAVGLERMIALTPEGFVRVATDLAGNVGELAELRAGLRTRMLQSPLLDAVRFTRHLEAAYREIWARRCALGGGR